MADRVVTVIPARKTFARASETNVLRVAAYARVSTGSDEQMGSVAAQKDYFEKLIQKNACSFDSIRYPTTLYPANCANGTYR